MFSFPAAMLLPEHMIVAPSRKRTAIAMYAQAKSRAHLRLSNRYFVRSFRLTPSRRQVPSIRLLVLEVFHGVHFPNIGHHKRCAQCIKWTILVLCLVLLSVIWLFQHFPLPSSCIKICVYQTMYQKKRYIFQYIPKYTSICIKNSQYVSKMLVHEAACIKIFDTRSEVYQNSYIYSTLPCTISCIIFLIHIVSCIKKH